MGSGADGGLTGVRRFFATDLGLDLCEPVPTAVAGAASGKPGVAADEGKAPTVPDCGTLRDAGETAPAADADSVLGRSGAGKSVNNTKRREVAAPPQVERSSTETTGSLTAEPDRMRTKAVEADPVVTGVTVTEGFNC